LLTKITTEFANPDRIQKSNFITYYAKRKVELFLHCYMILMKLLVDCCDKFWCLDFRKDVDYL